MYLVQSLSLQHILTTQNFPPPSSYSSHVVRTCIVQRLWTSPHYDNGWYLLYLGKVHINDLEDQAAKKKSQNIFQRYSSILLTFYECWRLTTIISFPIHIISMKSMDVTIGVRCGTITSSSNVKKKFKDHINIFFKRFLKNFLPTTGWFFVFQHSERY